MAILTGNVGKLKVGYHEAATLDDWTVISQQETLGPPTVGITAHTSAVDSFQITQKPVLVGLWMGKTWWVWQTINGVTREQGVVMAQLYGNPVVVLDF